MASSRDLRSKLLNTLTRKIPNRRIPRRIIVVGIPREYMSIVY
jgi:CHASE2 domain-containing sensor protein